MQKTKNPTHLKIDVCFIVTCGSNRCVEITVEMNRTTSSNNSSPDLQWNEAKTLLENNTYYVVHRAGPTVLSIRGESDEVYKVIIGNPHSCSCKKSIGFCVHILFVILKVLRIPDDHPLAKKINLTDSEIDFALAGNFGGRTRPTIVRKEKKPKVVSTVVAENQEEFVERQPMDDESPDICPICQDDMSKDDALTWCRKGCGNNIHAKCMKLYAQYKTTNSTTILCPLCREDWGPNALQVLNEDCKGKASLKKACSSSQCQTCTFQIRGDLFRCIECSLKSYQQLLATSPDKQSLTQKIQPVDFCSRCFQNVTREHARHHFITSPAIELLSDFEWKYVKNPRAPQQLIDESILNTLQQREFTDEDYDFLLGLDQKSSGIPLQQVLIDSLPIKKPTNIEERKCWCDKYTSDVIHSLPCGHNVHEHCLSSMLGEALVDGCWKLDEIHCGYEDCRASLFKGISRKRFKLKKSNVEESSVLVANNTVVPKSDNLLSGISGISINGSTSKQSTLSASRQQFPNQQSSSRKFLHRQLEINKREEAARSNQSNLQLLCIGGETNRQLPSIGSEYPKPPRSKKISMPPKRLRSLTDSDETLNSLSLVEGVIARPISVETTTLTRERMETSNRIPIRKKAQENIKIINETNNNENNNQALSLGGVGIYHNSSVLTVPDEVRQGSHPSHGKRIKSSPAVLLAAKRKSTLDNAESGIDMSFSLVGSCV